MNAENRNAASLAVDDQSDGSGQHVRLSGNWRSAYVHLVLRDFEKLLHQKSGNLTVDLSEITDIDTRTAEWLLEWGAFRLRDREDFPELELTSDSGMTATVGTVGEPVAVSGSSVELVGWLLGRTDGSAITGAGGLQLPAF